MRQTRGVFIALEGIDGSGKSTHFRLLVQYLRRCGYAVCATREPGGTRIGERVRAILLDPGHRELAPLAELALIYAARAQHLAEVIRPALAQGKVVVSDRYNLSSFAYQGYGRKLGLGLVGAMDAIVCGKTQPDLTLIFDVPARVALRRATSHRSRFEREGVAFQERVRQGYLALAAQRRRVKTIPTDGPAPEVQAQVRRAVSALLQRRLPPRR
jgi:dTMP kinase